MNIYEKLGIIQSKLKAPKGQYNSFGKYKYRSCEDILEAVKPLLAETKTVLSVTDRMEVVGDRIYVRAEAHSKCVYHLKYPKTHCKMLVPQSHSV